MVPASNTSACVIGAAKLLICSGCENKGAEIVARLALSNRPDGIWTLSFDSHRQYAELLESKPITKVPGIGYGSVFLNYAVGILWNGVI
jgi:hypothetical protein